MAIFYFPICASIHVPNNKENGVVYSDSPIFYLTKKLSYIPTSINTSGTTIAILL